MEVEGSLSDDEYGWVKAVNATGLPYVWCKYLSNASGLLSPTLCTVWVPVETNGIRHMYTNQFESVRNFCGTKFGGNHITGPASLPNPYSYSLDVILGLLAVPVSSLTADITSRAEGLRIHAGTISITEGNTTIREPTWEYDYVSLRQ